MTHAEPFLLRTYCGDAEKLADAVTAILQGKEVVVPCLVDGPRDQLQLRKGKLQIAQGQPEAAGLQPQARLRRLRRRRRSTSPSSRPCCSCPRAAPAGSSCPGHQGAAAGDALDGLRLRRQPAGGPARPRSATARRRSTSARGTTFDRQGAAVRLPPRVRRVRPSCSQQKDVVFRLSVRQRRQRHGLPQRRGRRPGPGAGPRVRLLEPRGRVEAAAAQAGPERGRGARQERGQQLGPVTSTWRCRPRCRCRRRSRPRRRRAWRLATIRPRRRCRWRNCRPSW